MIDTILNYDYIHIMLSKHIITIRVRLICKIVSTGQNSTGQNRTEQGRTGQDKIASIREREIIFFIFENKMGIFVFFILVPWTKSCTVV
jgi:hypothetical protein